MSQYQFYFRREHNQNVTSRSLILTRFNISLLVQTVKSIPALHIDSTTFPRSRPCCYDVESIGLIWNSSRGFNFLLLQFLTKTSSPNARSVALSVSIFNPLNLFNESINWGKQLFPIRWWNGFYVDVTAGWKRMRGKYPPSRNSSTVKTANRCT